MTSLDWVRRSGFAYLPCTTFFCDSFAHTSHPFFRRAFVLSSNEFQSFKMECQSHSTATKDALVAKASPAQVSINRLPPELIIIILSHVSDARSLMRLALVSKTVYHGFMVAERDIAQAVCINQTDPLLMREVVAVIRSMQMSPWSSEKVTQDLKIFFTPEPDLTVSKWDLKTAVSIWKVQNLVKAFTAGFASSALLKLGGDTANIPFTRSELRRFERAFWRFELYCNLFRNTYLDRIRRSYFIYEQQKEVFLDRLPPLENEQLTCVYDYLRGQIAEAVEDIAAHDIEWGGEWQIPWLDDYNDEDCAVKDALLSRGLANIYKLRNTRTYDQRMDFIGRGEKNWPGCPEANDDFLFNSLSLGHEDLVQSTLTQEEIEGQYFPKSLCDDGDPGPRAAWRWGFSTQISHAQCVPDNWYYRQRAYVMWDMLRISKWGILTEDRDLVPREIDLAYTASSRELDVQKASMSARSEIYHKGGRGWWEPGDESFVQWITGDKKLYDEFQANGRRYPVPQDRNPYWKGLDDYTFYTAITRKFIT